MTHYPSYYLGFNKIRQSRWHGELQILKANVKGFCSYENGFNILPIFRLFDQTPYFCVKRFLQTVFSNDLMGCYFVQRNRNIAAAAPLSRLVPNSKSGVRAMLKNGLRFFFWEPQTHMYRASQLDLIFTFASTKASHTHLEGFGDCSL